jgi:hypothetical protein
MFPDATETAHPPGQLADLVASLKEAWRGGAPPDTARALREHPELLRDRSFVVDLAYEEYCLREEAGHTPDAEEFCRGLPAFQSQVGEVIRGHRMLADNPDLFVKPAVCWPQPADRFEGLTVVRELGRGAFARAYLARDPDTGDRPVVLKLSPSPSGEARTLGPMQHPNVVGVHWARTVRGMHAICMPFVGSATLLDVIAAVFNPVNGPPSARTVLDVADVAHDAPHHAVPLLCGRESYADAVAAVGACLADAIAYLHRSGVGHGDLKPSNVILGPGAHPYLIDFNLATGPNDESLLRCGGTLPYMAPERLRLVRGEPADSGLVDRADVYSLGVVLFEALTGRVPFPPAPLLKPSEAAADLLRQQSAGLPRLGAANPRVPRSLARVVEWCLAADPRQRPTAEQLRHALDHHLGRWVRRFRWLLGGVVLASGLVAWQYWPGPASPGGGPQPTEPAAIAPTPSTPKDLFERGRERLKAGDVASAAKDIDDAHRMRPDGPSTALLAYCRARSASHLMAAVLYQQAIAQHGYDVAWVRNNRAYSLIQCGTRENLRLAVEESTVALQLDPNSRAARLNRATARFKLNLDPKSQTLADPECLADLDAVLVTGPFTADLCYNAALILTASGSGQEDRYTRAIGYLRDAVALGKPPRHVAQDPILLKHLAGRPDFQQVTQLPPVKPPQPPLNPQLISPPDR